MPADSPDQPTFDFIGGQLSLDFANTVGGLRGQITTERLAGYSDLVAWAFQAKVLGRAAAQSLRGAAIARPKEAQRVFATSLDVREAIYAIGSAVAASAPVPTSALNVINAELPAALANMRLTFARNEVAWTPADGNLDLETPVRAIVRATLDLLTSDRLPLVRECSGDSCGWLFLDTTRNHSRLWCDMRGCGNRAKVRRHRTRRARLHHM
jgi:predicted RNA-binding Zn ribbon-like protein